MYRFASNKLLKMDFSLSMQCFLMFKQTISQVWVFNTKTGHPGKHWFAYLPIIISIGMKKEAMKN